MLVAQRLLPQTHNFLTLSCGGLLISLRRKLLFPATWTYFLYSLHRFSARNLPQKIELKYANLLNVRLSAYSFAPGWPVHFCIPDFGHKKCRGAFGIYFNSSLQFRVAAMRLTDNFAQHVIAQHSTSKISQCKIVKYTWRRSTGVSRRHGPIEPEFRTHAGPNWDNEMSLFRKRVNSPNQMETMRKIEAEVEVGKVDFCFSTLCKQLYSFSLQAHKGTSSMCELTITSSGSSQSTH